MNSGVPGPMSFVMYCLIRQVPSSESAGALKLAAAAIGPVPRAPTMDGLASRWAASHPEGVRVARGEDIRRILSAGGQSHGRGAAVAGGR